MTIVSENHTVNTVQARSAILKAFKTKRPIYMWGPPGIGKSETVRDITEQLGGLMIDLRMAQMEPTDIRGIPYYNKELNKMDWAPPVDFPDEELASQYPIVVLFMDEMNSGAPAVQAAAYQLVLDRRVGKYVLPDNVVIVAAGNRESDKGVTYRMPAPLKNRFIHIELKNDFKTWQNWAVQHNVHPDVVGYLTFSEQDLYTFDHRSSSNAFATPRSWVFVSELLNDTDHTDGDTLFTLIAGCIGDGLAHKFIAHRKYASKMPNPEDILTGKVTTLDIKEISAMYSLTIAMCYRLKALADDKKVSRDDFHVAVDYFLNYMMENFEPELTVMGTRIGLVSYSLPIEPSRLKHFDKFHKKFGKHITENNEK